MATGPGLSIFVDEKRYAGSAVATLSELHIALAPGSVTAIVGPSGTGKSTLLRLLAGIDGDFAGRVTIDDRPAAEAPAAGFVFQDPRLLPWLTVLDNVRVAATGVSTERAEAALGKMGLADSSLLYPHQLSGGMQRRVALARALAPGSGLLLLDEPFVSLDRALVADMHGLIATIAAADRPTMVLVTHMAADAAVLADRVLVLSGAPAELVADIALPIARAERGPAVLNDYRALVETGIKHAALRRAERKAQFSLPG